MFQPILKPTQHTSHREGSWRRWARTEFSEGALVATHQVTETLLPTRQGQHFLITQKMAMWNYNVCFSNIMLVHKMYNPLQECKYIETNVISVTHTHTHTHTHISYYITNKTCLSQVIIFVLVNSVILRRADHSSRGVIATVVRPCVWSRNL